MKHQTNSNEMEINNLPAKELKKSDYKDVHTWEKKGGTQWELKILDKVRKNQAQMKNSITEIKNN